ncbi:meckelin-like isoform X2 [Cydia strobilella]|uniref:meckelin-like isoform X2 n=1 Tax=Cydia strobilella TaxID=1100964 RepID=UPI003004CA85
MIAPWIVYIVFLIRIRRVMVLELPGSCKVGEYYETGTMTCQSCPGNASMATSSDGFSCSCEDSSIPLNPGRCKPCGATALVSADGATCVPRRCQTNAGRTVCRRCPSDYVSETQNFDGSPMKEVLCVKCARGFKAVNNACVRCPACACAKNEMAVRDVCVPKSFVTARPKYEGVLHPSALLDIIKHEYLCIIQDYRACRRLASECVNNFYPSDAAGPCRLWQQRGLVVHKGLPPLLIESANDKEPGIQLPRGKESLKLAFIIYTSVGGFKILQDAKDAISPCFSAIEITIGKDFTRDCVYNMTDLPLSDGDTLALYLQSGDDYTPLPVALRKPGGSLVQRATWPSSKFRRYFVVHNSLSPTNSTNTIYLRTLLLHLRMQRSKSLSTHMTIEAQYATKQTYSRSVTTTLRVEHEMPSAGVLKGLEIWGGVLGALLSCYALVQWRGVLRRGGLQISLLPLLAGSIADAMYFAAWLATLHALAAEAGSHGLTLPPATAEEHIIRAFVFSSISLKAIKAAWVNWRQCRCDVFFLDWSEYNPPIKGNYENNLWKTMMVAREWSSMQTKRRANPGFTVALTLVILHLLTPWQLSLPNSPSYTWAVGTLAWWAAYAPILLAQWVWDRIVGSPTLGIARVCDGVGLSLMVFQEEFYAHYVHGRNNGSPDAKAVSGPLEACRVVCAPQLRNVYKQLATAGLGAMDEHETRQALLSRFLAAFFERALDGLSWVASERTVLERLLDVELVAREAGNTSALLYDPDSMPSCFALSWWGEEWTLATLDAMLFGCILLATKDCLLAALVTLAVWQIAKQLRAWFGDKNLKQHIGIEDTL